MVKNQKRGAYYIMFQTQILSSLKDLSNCAWGFKHKDFESNSEYIYDFF